MENIDTHIQKDEERYTYKKLVIKENILAGCILYGDISGYRKILKAIEEKRNIQTIKEKLKHWDLSALKQDEPGVIV